MAHASSMASSVENLARKPHMELDMHQREREIAQKIPPHVFVGLALGSMVVSAAIAIFAKKRETANFVGLWAPSFLLIGIYDKLTRLEETEETQAVHRVA